jgi:YdjC-like protein
MRMASFLRSQKCFFKHNPKIEEIDAELRAQINLAKKKGVNIQYIDTHYMGMGDYSGLRGVIQKIGRDYKLPISSQMGEKHLGRVYRVFVKEKKSEALKMLGKLQPGLWLWVCHIGIDSPEQDALLHSATDEVISDGRVGRHRAAELDVVMSPEVKA